MRRVIPSMSMTLDRYVDSDATWPTTRVAGLVEAKSFADGVVVHIYTPQQEPATTWARAGGTAEEG